MKFSKFAWLLLAFWSSNAFAQVNATQEHLTKIFRGVMRSEILLTAKVHKQFWTELRQFSDIERAHLVRFTSAAALESHAYQVEVWESALLSFSEQKVFKSGKMTILENEMGSRILETLPVTLHKEIRRAAIEAFEAKLQETIQMSNLILAAAAKHQAIHLPGIGEIEMNKTSIRGIAVSLEGTLCRMQRLINPIWTEVALETRNSIAEGRFQTLEVGR